MAAVCYKMRRATGPRDVRERFTNVGLDAYSASSREFSEMVRGDVDRLGKMMAAAGIKGE